MRLHDYFKKNIQPAMDELDELMAARNIPEAQHDQIRSMIAKQNDDLKEYNDAQAELGQLLWRKDNIEREIEDAKETLQFACWKLDHNFQGDACENCGAPAPDDEDLLP